jgi:hypothetical protein
VAWVVLLALPALGQYEVGQASLTLNGTVGGGYAANYGNEISSSHGLAGSGSGTLGGNYYNPNFFSFNVSPYYGQSRSNSNYQSVFDSSGVNASASIFSGSHYPGSVSYAKSYNSEGNFGVPGVADYTTRGNSGTFGIAWSESIPDAPSFNVNFQRGANEYSVFGTDQNGSSNFDSFNLHSAYLIESFGLSAFYGKGSAHSLIPQLVGTDQEPETVNSSNRNYGFNVNRPLPFRGGFGAGISRSQFSTDLADSNYNGSVDLATATAGFQPTDKLHVGVGANYSDSLSGQLYEQVVAAGGVAPPANPSSGSHSMDVIASAGYAIMRSMQSEFSAERREQRFLGENFGSDSYSGSLIYTKGVLGGNLNAAATVRDSRLDGSSQNSLGFSVTTGYTRRINEWVMTGAFNYAQNVQTVLITYNTSFYSYTGTIRHRWGQLTWSAGAGAGRTGLTVAGSTQNTNQSYTSSIGYSRFFNLTASYSKSSGNGVQTANGIVQNPVIVPVLSPASQILFAGDAYSFGFGTNPVKKLTFGAAYARANNNSLYDSVTSNSSTSEYNTLLQYQFRKVYFTAGFTRMQQGFNTSTSGPAVISSFYIGLSRWFNFF